MQNKHGSALSGNKEEMWLMEENKKMLFNVKKSTSKGGVHCLHF